MATKAKAKAKTRAKAEVKRGADEIGFLKSRARSVPLGATLAREKVAELERRVLSTDAQSGGDAHDEGSALIEIYMRHADAALGYRTFKAFLDEHWPLDQAVAYERMQIARLCTHDQAVKFGYTVCVLGLRIMRMLAIETIEEFLRTPLPLHPDDGDGSVRFPAPSRALRSVLRQIAARTAVASTTASHPHDVARRYRRYREIVDEISGEDATVAHLKPVVWADAAGVYVRVTAGGPPQVRAAARLYQRLGKVTF